MVWLRLQTSRARRIARLSFPDWLLLVQAWLLLACIDVSLRLFGLTSTRSWFRSSVLGANRVDSAVSYRLIGWAARLHPWPIRCLARSLVLETFVPGAELTIGVRRAGEILEAHAWVMEDGSPVGESLGSLAGFSVLAHGEVLECR